MHGSIPVLMVSGRSLAEAWERSLICLWKQGCDVRTEYDARDDNGDFVDPPSKDSTMTVVVEDPLSEPYIHRAFPGALEDLEEYRLEVLEGIKDHWVKCPDDPEDTRWEYTYHGRLRKYDIRSSRTIDIGYDGRPVVNADNYIYFDQLKSMVTKLAETPYSRRCNAVTWQPWRDIGSSDPPCLQSIWCRILSDEDGVWRLNMNVRFRSRDAYDAAFMNMFAFILLQEDLARQIAGLAGREVKLGRYCDLSDSYHIYGKRMHGKPPNFVDGFLKMLRIRPWADRVWTREFAQPMFDEARPQIFQKVREQDGKQKT